MPSERKSGDHLNLVANDAAKRVMAKFADKSVFDETIHFSDIMTKINRKEKHQSRALVITNEAMYNMTPDYKKCKRRIAIKKVSSVTVAQGSEEFVFHVHTEYDYRFFGPRKPEVVETMERLIFDSTGEELRVDFSAQLSLKAVTVTRTEAKSRPADASPASGPESKDSEPPAPAPAGMDTTVGDLGIIEEGGETEDEDAAAGGGGGSEKKDDDEEEDEFAGEGRGRATTGWAREETSVSMENFELLQVIGRGSFGKVMLVKMKETGEILAMKILKKAEIVRRNQVEHTKAERQILETISHPFLVKLKCAFQNRTKLYLILPYLRGGELFHHLKKARRFSMARARFYAAEIASGLGHLHKNGIIYRDLKPENILLDEQGHIRLTDFGLSKGTGGDKTKTFCGTPEYLAPEVINDIPHDKAVDWWSLGILLYEMMYGLPPFYSTNVKIMYDAIRDAPLKIPDSAPPEVRSILVALLDRNPATRLGAKEDLEELKRHPFFAEIDFEALEALKISPPFKPKVKGETDVSNFDEEFTGEEVVDTYVKPSAVTAAEPAFDGFTFVDRSAISGDS